MNSLVVLKKRNQRAELPAFSNREIYELIYGKKPRQKKNRLWRKTRRFFHQSEQWFGSKTWGIACAVSCILIGLLFLSQLNTAQQTTLPPILLGAVTALYMVAFNRQSPEGGLFNTSGILAIVLAILLPFMVLNLFSSWMGAAYYLPAHLALCGIAARYRSDQSLEPAYIFHKALSYFVFTLTIGWLSYYSFSNW